MSNTISERIKELRIEKGITQVKLGEQLNVTDKAVSKWESGDGIPEINTLAKLAKVFNVTTDYLIYGDSKCDLLNSDLEEAASIFWKHANKLLNIYWKPCNLNVSKTIVKLYVITAGHSFHTVHDPRTLGDDLYDSSCRESVKMQFMNKFEVGDGCCYLAIPNLAKSDYSFKLSQVDKNGNILFETDDIYCYA